MELIHDEIFLQYGSPRDLLINICVKLLIAAIECYLRKLGMGHKTTTLYYSQPSRKVEPIMNCSKRCLSGIFSLLTRLFNLGRERYHPIAGMPGCHHTAFDFQQVATSTSGGGPKPVWETSTQGRTNDVDPQQYYGKDLTYHQGLC